MKTDPVAHSPVRPVGPLSPTGRRIMWVVLAPFIPVGILVVILVALLALHIARPYLVPNNSMSPALTKGDQFYSCQISYLFHGPHRGDVVCFWSGGISELEEHNQGVDNTFVKRVVGLPGETISLHDGHVWVNGKPAPELAYKLYDPAPEGTILTEDGDSFVVPADSYFVLGDNSPNSLDSRYWGCVPAKNLRGRVLFRFWPPAHMGLLN